MKYVIIGILLVALGHAPLAAQTPTVQAYFTDDFVAAGDCPNAPIGTVMDTLFVYANNFNMFMSSIEFMINYPPQMSWVTDLPNNNPLVIGTTPVGAAFAWTIPQNAFGPFEVCKVLFMWECNNCAGIENTPLVVTGHPSSGKVRSVRFPDNTVFEAVGMTSLVCATVPVEETSWGRLKALYR